MTRRVLKFLLGAPTRVVKGFRVDQPERLPGKRQPLILAANHAALTDSYYLILAVRPRFVICGARPAYFSTAPRRALMAIANILRVEDHDRFLSDCGALLGAGEILMIYPEMGRNPSGMGEFSSWAAEVALQNRVPILPCYLYGTTEGHEGSPRLFVGETIAPGGDPESLTRRLRHAITELAQSKSTITRRAS
jgi:1-acyl-sn-glycerol-3-phosphate acyltransferase